MNDFPSLDDNQIMELQASGKISPTTAEAMKTKRPWWERPGSELLKESTEYKPQMSKEVAEKALSDPNSALAKDYPEELQKAASFYGIQKPEERAPAAMQSTEVKPQVEKVDLSQLAVKPTQQQPQQPNIMDQGLKGINSAYGAQMGAVNRLGQAQQESFENQAKLMEEASRKQAEYDNELKRVRDERNAYENDFMKRREELVKEVDKAGDINPNRYWENKSTGNKISASIGIALGAIGSAMTGQGGNKALDIIQNAIDRDIDAQKANANKAQQRLQNQDSIFNLALKKYGDQETAMLAARSEALSRVELQIKAQANQSQSKEAKAKADLLSAQILEEKQKTDLALNQTAGAKYVASQATMGQGVENPALLPEDMQKRAVKMPNGLYKPALNEQAAKTVNEQAIGAASVKNILSQMKELASPTVPFTVKKAKIEGLKAEYTALKKNEMQLGVMSDSDRQLVEATIGNPGGLLNERAIAMLDQAAANVDYKLGKTYEMYVPGYKPLRMQKAPDMRK